MVNIVLGNTNEDEFVSMARKLGYELVTKKIDCITAAAIWQELNIPVNSQRLTLCHLSDFLVQD